jgi:deoxycytidylate deaminase
MPHCEDGYCPRFIEGTASFSSYDNCIATHAEANALIHSNRSAGQVLYVNGIPCWDCAKKIASAQIMQLVCVYDPYEGWERTKSFLEEAGVEVSVYKTED